MVDAIFLQSHAGEILNGRFFRFIEKFKSVFDFSVPLFIFFSNEARQILKNNPPLVAENVHYVYFDEPIFNSPSVFFYSIINYAPEEYKQVLLLETDCVIRHGFLQSINSEVCRFENFLMFGSKYYGRGFRSENISTWLSEHINGVAVYNRTRQNLKFIHESFRDQEVFIDDFNYDVAICKQIMNKKINFQEKLVCKSTGN